jgi:hypothetical protein
MLKPIYFPFTYVPQWVAEALAACFKQFIVYQPTGRSLPAKMQPWIEANIMDVHVPVRNDEEAISKTVKDLQAYAGLHDDGKHSQSTAFRGSHGAIPFFGESAVSRIALEVKNSSRKALGAMDIDPLFYARVFLEFAHEFDRQNDELSENLGIHDQRSRDLLEKISGEKRSGLPPTQLTAKIRIEDSTEYMALDRFQAWLRLYRMDPIKSKLFITCNPTIFNHLVENLAGAEKVIQSEHLPRKGAEDDATLFWRDGLLKLMARLGAKHEAATEHAFGNRPLPEDRRSNVRLTLYRVPGHPANLFSGIFQGQETDGAGTDPGVEFTHTLIGLIVRQPLNA